jgi:hypothetical protein
MARWVASVSVDTTPTSPETRCKTGGSAGLDGLLTGTGRSITAQLQQRSLHVWAVGGSSVVGRRATT